MATDTELEDRPAHAYLTVLEHSDELLSEDQGHLPTYLRQLENIGRHWSVVSGADAETLSGFSHQQSRTLGSSAMSMSEELLDYLERLSHAGAAPTWKSWIEGRDHTSGDSFIQIGTGDARQDDMYISRDSGAWGQH